MSARLPSLKRSLVCFFLIAYRGFASDPAAAQLAREAKEAQNHGQLVRAYLLYGEAAARDSGNLSYRVNRDSLASAAKLLSEANIQKADVTTDIKNAEAAADEGGNPAFEAATSLDWARANSLQGLPKLAFHDAPHDFHLRANARTLYEQVTAAYGVRLIFDRAFTATQIIRFDIVDATFKVAMEALTDATNTFLFPVSETSIFVAADTQLKRTEFEPSIVLTIPLPEASDQKQLLEAANAVRSALTIRTLAYDSQSRTVLIRDRASRANIARSLLEALLLPRAQVALQVQVLTLDTSKMYHYGVSLPTSFTVVNLARLGFQTMLPTNISNAVNYLGFGGGSSLFGLGIASATMFASYSESFAQSLYDATAVAMNGESAEFHVGDKYPIPTSLYSGFQQSAASIYNPIGQTQLEDLGLILKLKPHVGGNSDVTLEVEAQYKALGTQTFNTIPAISQREFKGTVRLPENAWAIVAGMDQDSSTITRSGLLGLSQIPGLNQALSENTRDRQTSNTMIVIKPQITRLPMSETISPQYLIGPQNGRRVIL